MPTYDYHCDKCNNEFSKTETMSRHGRRKPACPKCKSTAVRQVFTAFYAKTVRKS